MHKMMKAIIRRRKGSMANGDGNGNGGYSNGRSGSGVFAIAQLASTGVLILGMFGLWWQSADPKARLDKIETIQLDNRKELNDTIVALRKDISERYVSQREHAETGNRIKAAEEEEAKNHVLSMPKAEFEAWRRERENLVKTELTRLDVIENDLKAFKKDYIARAEHVDLQERIRKLEENVVTRAEHTDRWTTEYKVDADTSHRIDLLVGQLDKLRENTTTNPTGEAMSRRIDQLNEGMRQLQTQLFEILHNRNTNVSVTGVNK